MPEPLNLVVGAIVTFLVTLCLNRFLSMFRYRQLYAVIYDDVQDVYSGGRGGGSFTVVMGNKGKDVEEDVELHLLEADYLEIVSSDSLGVKVSGGAIKVDRILKGEKIKICVSMEGMRTKFSKKNVRLRSAEAKGYLFFKHGVEPVGLGPVFFNFSIAVVFLGWLAYGVHSGVGLFYPYYALRYWEFYNSGFEVDEFSETRLLDGISPFSERYPIKYMNGWVGEGIVALVFEVENTANVPIMVSASTSISSDAYKKEQDLALVAFGEGRREEAFNKLREEFGTTSAGVKEEDVLIPPQERAIVIAVRKHGSKSQGIDFFAKLTVGFEDSVKFSDRDVYMFYPDRAGIKNNDLKQIPEK